MAAGRNPQTKQTSVKLNTYASMTLWGNSPEGRIVFGRHWSGETSNGQVKLTRGPKRRRTSRNVAEVSQYQWD